MKSVSETIIERRSIRKFADKKVDLNVVKKIVETACWAPSACNRQQWKFILIEDKKLKEKLVELGAHNPLLQAPIVIAVFYNKFASYENNAGLQSAAAAIQNILLLATEQGLGSLWMAKSGNAEKVKKLLKVPEEFFFVSFVLLGYAKEKPLAPKRKPLNEVFSINSFSGDYFPASVFPEEWNLKKLTEYQQQSCRALPAGKEYLVVNNTLEKAVSEFVIPRIKEKNLDFLSYDGSLLKRILEQKNTSSFELSKEVAEIIKQGLEKKGIKRKPVFLINKDSRELIVPAKDKSFDTVTIMLKLEMMNSKDKEKLVREVSRILDIGGKAIVLIQNKNSLKWLKKIYRLKFKGEYLMEKHFMSLYNVGPFYALSLSEVLKLFKKNGFRQSEKKNFWFYPKQANQT
ncbi:MAG: nitroreductase family protein [archaeon]